MSTYESIFNGALPYLSYSGQPAFHIWFFYLRQVSSFLFGLRWVMKWRTLVRVKLTYIQRLWSPASVAIDHWWAGSGTRYWLFSPHCRGWTSWRVSRRWRWRPCWTDTQLCSVSSVCDLWFVRCDIVLEVISRPKWPVYLITCASSVSGA